MANVCLIHNIEKPCELCIDHERKNLAEIAKHGNEMHRPRARKWGAIEDLAEYISALSQALYALGSQHQKHIDPDSDEYRGCESQPCACCEHYNVLHERYPDLGPLK